MKNFEVLNTRINYFNEENADYISLTDMLKSKDGEFFISDWLRNRNTIEFLGIWEELHNPNFNYGEFAIIKSQAGLNSYKISVKEWSEKTNAIGIVAKTGRYGGTYAHKDIAFEFGMWISPKFKIYLIKELTSKQVNLVYAEEADVLNMALFGMTAKEWREINPNKKGNIRDYASINELICLANLENTNSIFINEGMQQSERLYKLNQIAISQMRILTKDNERKLLKKYNEQ